MTIQGEDFILTPINEHALGFDLELLQTINKGKSNERKEFKNVAYALPLDVAIEKIAHYRIRRNAGDSVVELKSYIEQLNKERKIITDLCNGEKEIPES
jgi:hypothetical protein